MLDKRIVSGEPMLASAKSGRIRNIDCAEAVGGGDNQISALREHRRAGQQCDVVTREWSAQRRFGLSNGDRKCVACVRRDQCGSVVWLKATWSLIV